MLEEVLETSSTGQVNLSATEPPAGWLLYSTDGRYTDDDIVEKVAGEITPAEV